MSLITETIRGIQNGSSLASEQLFMSVHNELRKLASSLVARERPGQTLQATALVHEVYLRLVGVNCDQEWDGQHHFFAAAGEAMRRILVERARHKATIKGGGGLRRLDLDDARPAHTQQCKQLLAVHEALQDLEKHDALAAEIVKLRYFVGMSHQEAAEAMRISRRTADRLWALAKAWLYCHLTTD